MMALHRPSLSRIQPVAWAGLAALLIAALPPLLAGTALVGGCAVLLVLARPGLGLALLALAVPLGPSVEVMASGLPLGPTELLAGLVVASWLAAVLARRRDRVDFGLLVWPMLAFLGAGLLSASLAESFPSAAKELLRWLELLLVYVAATSLLREEADRRIAIGAVLLAGVGEALLGIAQFFTRIGPPSFVIGPFLRAYGTFGQPNPFAGYLGMILPLAIALAVCWRPSRRDWLWRLSWVAAALIAAAIGMSMSRGAWLGVVLGGSVLAVLVSRRAVRFVAWGAGASVLALLLGAINLLPASLTQRVTTAVAYFRIFDARGVYPEPHIWAIVERMAHWQSAWEMLVDHPLFGVGPGHYVLAYPRYAILPYWEDPLGHAHNFYLHVAAELGILGLVLYLVMVGSWLWLGLSLARRLKGQERQGFQRAVAVGVVACLTAASAHNLFDNLYVQGMNVHVALLLGIIASIYGSSGDSGRWPRTESPRPASAPRAEARGT